MQTEFFRKKLKNGLTILFEKRNLPVVAVSASVRLGGAYETEKNKGVSHFIEHLLFKGTKKRNQEEIAAEIEKKGGILNGFTSEDVTSYWCKLPSKHFETAMDIPSDLILNPLFDIAEFEKEKQVIIEEIKMYHDDARRYSTEKIKELLYEKPFGMSIAGDANIIRALKRENVAEIFSSLYTPDSMILAVVGDAEFEEICRIAEKLYPAKKRSAIDYAAVRRNDEASEKRKGIDQAHFVFGLHAPTIKQQERYAHEIAGEYLFGGMSSRLFQEIREKRGLAYAVKGEYDCGRNYGYVMIYAGTTEDKIKTIREIILKEIKRLKDTEQRDIDEIKEQLIGQRDISRENSVDVLNSLMFEEAAGSAEEYYKYSERISSVKPGDVKRVSEIKGFSSFSLIPEAKSNKNIKNKD